MTAARTTGFRTPAPVAAPTVTRTRLRITARGRAVLSVLVALPFTVAILLALLNGGVAVADEGGSTVTVTVSAGQTLWSLAEAIAPGSNPADVVADIVAVNALDGGAVQAGQTLVLPAAYAD
ncbi:LysM peptidoglycan-binding domain-containing protein [Microcella daejeonensis]|uniref:LysM peptidoglycan-binding domain-containing protein n=1 Tax=Microcella daejeonensis TaxID=2994971 RepID=UPI00226D6ACE|nr:LysM peptidoglycan-binding domain-containing protein [Microcella daejeonensis]WAB83662.1 LysM peptidoglycan-binding domain-containing protein [Microcella daejeonensis]